jgi:tetratricopeptide (TPR) repeat protein
VTAKRFERPLALFAFVIAAWLTPAISRSQNARVGSESGLDRLMQQNAVKDRGFPLAKDQKIDKVEEAAYKAFVAALKEERATKIRLGEDFAAKFPSSHYLPAIYGVLTTSYFATGDTDKMFAAGTKALQLDPKDVDVMAVLAVAIPRRVKPNSPEATERLQAAEIYAQRAIDIIPTLPKPAKMDDASFEKIKNNKLALAHSGLGLILIDRKKYDDARDELTQATELASTPDPVDYFLLGNADVEGSHFSEAVAAYEKCSSAGPVAEQCKAGVESAKHEAEMKNVLLAKGPRARADSWYPPDVDAGVPEVDAGAAACRMDEVLSETGKKIQDLVANVDKFTATETVEHQGVDPMGDLKSPEIRKFNYLVSIEQLKDGYLNVEEYRDGGSSPDQFPDHIATAGTPTLILIFHPNNAKNFEMKCEGLGQWQGHPAWQVRFEERTDRHPAISALVMSGRSFALRLRGRAWILADSYQVARLECDLLNEIPEVRLRLQHEDIEYRPVSFRDGKAEFWLPSSTRFYMDFRGHRFYRLHRFTDFQLFSVDVDQKLSNLKN